MEIKELLMAGLEFTAALTVFVLFMALMVMVTA
jgi:hypothetical protein